MKKYFKFLFLFNIFAMFVCFSGVLAQQKMLIKGSVKDQETKEAMIGVSVAEMDATGRYIGGTVTDINGEFALRVVSQNNKLSFQFIGYKNKIEEISGRSAIDITLESESTQLDEVVISTTSVNLGNISTNQRDVAMAVSRIDAKEIEDLAAASVDEALQGRLAGVDIVANTGDPGAGMSVRIRGTSTIGANAEPLIIVDGIPYDTKLGEDFDAGAADEESFSQLLNIPVEEIKDISISKDAAAAAQYGSRAANGIISITTKRGQKGKPRVSFATKNTVSVQPKGIPLLSGDQYAMLIRESNLNVSGRALTYPEFAYDPSSRDFYLYSQNTDWVGAVTEVGTTTENNLSVSGGGEKAKYIFSLGSYNQTGTTIGTGLNRITSSIKLDYTVSSKIMVTADFSYSHVVRESNYSNVREMALKKMPNMSIYERDPVTGAPTGDYFTPADNAQGDGVKYYNPVAMANLAHNTLNNERIRPTLRLKYNIVKPLMLLFDVNFDINNKKEHSFQPLEALGVDFYNKEVNKASDTDQDVYKIYTATGLAYSPDLGQNHTMRLFFQHVTDESYSTNYEATVPNQASSYLTDPSIPGNLTEAKLSSKYSQSRSVGELLWIDYKFLDRYMVQGGIRRDGSSKFGKNKRFGYFPSIGGRWRVSDEPFMKKFVFLSDFSLRADYGINGNPPDGSFSYVNKYSTIGYQYAGQAAVAPSNIELTNLQWEVTSQVDFGANLSLWKNRVSADFDIYQKRTTDFMAKGLEIATTTGFSTVEFQNVGIIENRGWELGLNVQAIRGKNLDVDLGFNIARNRNLLREIADNYPQEKGKDGQKAEYLQIIQEDNPLGSFYGYRYKGVYPTQADAIAKDANGTPTYDFAGNPRYMSFGYQSGASNYFFTGGDAIYEDINYDGNINAMDIVYLGDAYPRFTGGFNTRFVYRKNLALNLFFNYRYDNDIINMARYYTENMRNLDNQSTAVLARWRNPGDITDIPRAIRNRGYNDLASSRFVEDGSFIRMRATLSYNLPKQLLKKLSVQACKLVLTTNNLLTFTNYTGVDPEVSYSSGSNPFKVGRDESRTPRTRDFTLGLNISF